MRDFKLKLTSTTKAQGREAKLKYKQSQEDPIEQLKSDLRVRLAGSRIATMSLPELEAAVRAKIFGEK